MPVWCGGMLESGVGRAHNIALASLPNFTIPGDFVSFFPLLGAGRRVSGSDGADRTITVPEGPGIGFAVDREYVAHVTVRREAFGRGGG